MRRLHATRRDTEEHADSHIWLRICWCRYAPENLIHIKFGGSFSIETDKVYIEHPVLQSLQKRLTKYLFPFYSRDDRFVFFLIVPVIGSIWSSLLLHIVGRFACWFFHTWAILFQNNWARIDDPECIKSNKNEIRKFIALSCNDNFYNIELYIMYIEHIIDNDNNVLLIFKLSRSIFLWA